MVFHRYTVITQNIDLFRNFLTALQAGLHFIHFANPFTVDAFGYIILKFGIFDIFGIRINWIYGRITLLIRTVLLKSVETTGYFLGILGYRFFQVTAGRRYRTDKRNRTGFTVIQLHVSGTAVEVGNNRRQVHRECVGTGQLFHTVGHLAQCLSPTGSRVGHQQYFQSHTSVVFRNRHGCVHRCFTGGYRHVGSIGDNNSTLHQFTACMRVNQFGEFRKDFHNLIGTFTTGGDDYNVSFSLFGDSMLKHRLTRTERTGDKSRTAFYNRINGVNHTYTRFQQFERTRFFLIVRHGTFHRPFLNHIHLDIITFLVSQNGNCILNTIITLFHDRLHGTYTLLLERNHNLQWLKVLIHLSQPCSGFHLVANLCQRYKMPFTSFIQRIRVLSALQENAIHFIKVILQTVIVFRKHTGT